MSVVKSILSRIHLVIFGMILLSYVTFLMLPACVLSVPFPLPKRLRVLVWAWKIFGWIIFIGLTFRKPLLIDHRPKHQQGELPEGLSIANHQGYLDIPLMAMLIPIPPIMKREVVFIPILGFVAWASAPLILDRRTRDSRKEVFIAAKHRMLTQKLPLHYYPEGTRSKDGQPKAFEKIKTTLINLAWEEKIPVSVTSLYGTRALVSMTGKIDYSRRLGMILHKAIHPQEYASANEFAQACWKKVVEGHAELKQRLS
jgi:1-acyl-sn-glycerol-3-phosphate acyltransferase